MKMTWSRPKQPSLLLILSAIVILSGVPGLTQRPGSAAASVSPACPRTVIASLARFPEAQGICVPLGEAPTTMAEDATIGHALVFNTHDPSATTIDVQTGRVFRTVPLGSAYDYVWVAVDARTHHFFVSIQRGYYRTGANVSNHVYMLDARTGAVLRSLADVAQPAEVLVDSAHGHVFVADTRKSSVLMYDSRSGALLRAVPSCQDSEVLALSTSTDHLFVRCINGVMVMLDAATGKILFKEGTPTSSMDTTWRRQRGVDTAITVNERTHRIVVSDPALLTSNLYDAATGRLLRVLPIHGDFFADPMHDTFLFVPRFQSDMSQAMAGQVSVLSGTTGTVLHPFRVPGINAAAVQMNPRTGHLVVVLDGPRNESGVSLGLGTLRVIDAKSGKVLRSLTLAVEPGSLFVDAQANRLGVLGIGNDPLPGTLTLLNLDQL